VEAAAVHGVELDGFRRRGRAAADPASDRTEAAASIRRRMDIGDLPFVFPTLAAEEAYATSGHPLGGRASRYRLQKAGLRERTMTGERSYDASSWARLLGLYMLHRLRQQG
jgi:hypothetical protein